MEEFKISQEDALKAFQSVEKDGEKAVIHLFPSNSEIPYEEKWYIAACAAKSMTPRSIDQFSFLPENEIESAYANHLLSVIISALNGDWLPDYTNGEWKYWPYFYWNPKRAGGPGFSFDDFGYDDSISNVGARLVFKNRELAIFAGTQLEVIYNKFLTPYHPK